MSDKDLKKVSPFDIFNASSETIEEAQKKRAEESTGNRIEMFRLKKGGKSKIRILPLAPVKGEDGVYTLPRKGYEYPVKELLLCIKNQANGTNKPKPQYVNIRHMSHVFPQLQGEDLIDLFSKIACEKYADDEKLCKAIRSNSFSGGIKYDRRRYMYVLNLDEREKGIYLFSLSFSQYKELEDRKIDLWQELLADDENAQCPISSPLEAYPVEITSKDENGKVSYAININSRKSVPLTEDELNKLLSFTRLPEQLYRYTRFHLEATLAFLKQYEEDKDIDVLSDPRITDLVEKVKLLLPATDQSHFNPNGKSDSNEDAEGGKNTIDSLWDTFDKLADAGKDDKSEEGQNLRNAIIEFINDNELDVVYGRRVTNEELLNRCEDALKDADEAPAKKDEAEADDPEEADDETETDNLEPESEEESDEEEPAEPARHTHNDDTNEPAVRTDRRASRPARRRR